MNSEVMACPIWGSSHRAEVGYVDQTRMLLVGDSPRTGGKYAVSEVLVNSEIKHMTDHKKARLTTWLVDQRLHGNDMPVVTQEILTNVQYRHLLPVAERAYRLLKFIASKSPAISDKVNLISKLSAPKEWIPASKMPLHIRLPGVPEPKPKTETAEQFNPIFLEALAWTESTSEEEIAYLAEYLEWRGWIARPTAARYYEVTIVGHERIAEEGINVDSSQVFVAMWFDDSMNEAFDRGIEPAVVDTGYSSLRIDRKEHINKIDDEIIAELRRSRFLVADFTHGKGGARGGVYYEAGFAHGLNLPVIFTCHQDSLETLHFDTEHYSHIVWTHPEDLHQKLKNRILAVIGEGPGLYTSP